MEPYKMPAIMLRNARYRGQRESEKYLSDHQEQLYDIRQNWKDIDAHTTNQNSKIQEWFWGEAEENGEIVEITVEKTFKPSADVSSYSVIETYPIRNVKSVMVKLDNVDVMPNKYKVMNGSIVLDVTKAGNTSTPTELKVTMKAEVIKEPFTNRGIYLLKRRLQYIDERLAEAERRYSDYENAYE